MIDKARIFYQVIIGINSIVLAFDSQHFFEIRVTHPSDNIESYNEYFVARFNYRNIERMCVAEETIFTFICHNMNKFSILVKIDFI